MAWKAWSNFARSVRETASFVHRSGEEIRSMVAIEGEENLKRALEKKKGVLAVSAHLGNFTALGARLAASGYAYNVVVKHPRDRRFARLIDRYRAAVGVKTISAKPRREAVRGILKALRDNEIVLLIADEFKSGGVEVRFFGHKVPAPRGPVTLALRTGAPLLPVFVTRDAQDRLTLHLKPEIDLAGTGDLQEDVARNVGALVRELEAMIRRYPDQWNWLGFRRDGRRGRPKARQLSSEIHPS